jgi:hypothetical protein
MQRGDYRQLRKAFTAMALQQSDSPDVRLRWLAIAQACFDLEQELTTQGSTRKKAIRSLGVS